MKFQFHIGIDYSGAQTPTSRLAGLQVYATTTGFPERIITPAAPEARSRNWTRREIAVWLIEQAQKNIDFIVGIDHGFSFPIRYYQRYGLESWPQFLDDFCEHWPSDDDHTYVDFIRDREEGPPDRTGDPTELRLTEKWTSSAKSVFKFDVPGSVAKSTHAGLPWLRRIRAEVGDKVHFWPFDGWGVPEDKSVIAEVYPSVLRNRYARGDRTAHQQDAYCVARWLTEADERGFVSQYFQPSLTDEEREIADLEGWILRIL